MSILLAQFLLVAVLFVPILVQHDIAYIPHEHYCFIDYANVRVVLWLLCNIYGIPLTLLLLIYVRITLFLREHSSQQSLLIKQRQQRDLIVIRRIFVILGLLVAFGIPTFVLLIMLHIDGAMHPLFYRIVFLSLNFSLLTLSVAVAGLTPQVKNMMRPRRVVPLNASGATFGPVRHISSRV